MADRIDNVPPRIGAKLAALPEAVRPVAVLAYRCPHAGCRKPARVSLGSATKHAEKCIHNPAQRTCATCKHDAADDFGVECGLGERPDAVRFVRDCDSWEASHA